MTLPTKILKCLIASEEPLSCYRIAKKLNETYNAVKYHIKIMEKNVSILAVQNSENPQATYYVPNAFFTLYDEYIELIEPIIQFAVETIDNSDIKAEKKAKYNFSLLLSMFKEEIEINGEKNGKKQNNIRETTGKESRFSRGRLAKAQF